MKRYEYMTTNLISQQPGPEWRMVRHLNESYPFLWERVTEEPEPTPEPGYRWRCILISEIGTAWLVSPDGTAECPYKGTMRPAVNLDHDRFECGKRYSVSGCEHGGARFAEDITGSFLAVDDFTGKLWREEGK